MNVIPVFAYSFYLESNRSKRSTYLLATTGGVIAFLCMFFSLNVGEVTWDFKYVPLILAFLYGGRKVGSITFFIYLLARMIFIQDELLWYGCLIGVIVVSIPWYFAPAFFSFSREKRRSLAVLISIWPAFVLLTSLNVSVFLWGNTITYYEETVFHYAILTLFHIFASWIGVWIFELILERQQMREEILHREKVQVTGELAASMAHEIRNPLTVVKGFMQMLETLPEEKERYYPIIISELERAESIITEYLNFAKPQLNKMEVFAVESVIGEIVFLIQAFAEGKGVTVTLEASSLSIVETDRQHFKQAMLNFIKNAIEATEGNGAVCIKVVSTNGMVNIIIEDNGKGMTAEQQKRLGTFFYTTKEKGTGIGTAVSIRLIGEMGGEVTYKSEVDKGTTATIILPLYT